MWNEVPARAKSAIVALESDDVRILRFGMTASFGFGVEVLATTQSIRGFVTRVEALGLSATENRKRQMSESKPPAFVYDLFIGIPDGWRG